MSRRRLFRAAPDPEAGLTVGALAPMVDMMTLLLVFLLRTWTQDAPPATPSGFQLAGTSAGARQGGATLVVGLTEIRLDGSMVAALQGDSPDLRPLYDRLLATRDKGRLEIVADQRLPWSTLERILQIARSAGFVELSLIGASGA